MRFNRYTAIFLLLLLPATANAQATPPADKPAGSEKPAGYGKVALGTPIEEVKKAYPELEKLSEDKSLGAPIVGGPHITRYALYNQKIEGVGEPVTVELRFWDDKFWLYIVYFAKEQVEPVLAYLKKEYGPQTGPRPDFPIWQLGKTTVQVDLKNSRYTINDEALSREARNWFIGAFNARGGQQMHLVGDTAKTPSPAPQPTASPAKSD